MKFSGFRRPVTPERRARIDAIKDDFAAAEVCGWLTINGPCAAPKGHDGGHPAVRHVLNAECATCRQQFAIAVTWFGAHPSAPRLVPIHTGGANHTYRLEIAEDHEHIAGERHVEEPA